MLKWRHMGVVAPLITGRWTVCCSNLCKLTKKSIRLCITSPLWCETTGGRWVPLKNVSNTESVFRAKESSWYFPLPSSIASLYIMFPCLVYIIIFCISPILHSYIYCKMYKLGRCIMCAEYKQVNSTQGKILIHSHATEYVSLWDLIKYRRREIYI